MDQTVPGIIIVITIWVLSAIANRKKKAASGVQKKTTPRLKFDTRTGKLEYVLAKPLFFVDLEFECNKGHRVVTSVASAGEGIRINTRNTH